jgi:hypothetical protein
MGRGWRPYSGRLVSLIVLPSSYCVDSKKFPFLISEEGEGGGEDLVCRGRAV